MAATLNQHQRASKLALVCVVVMVVFLEVTSASAFPSLFTQSLFKRQQPQQQQQQQQQFQPLKPQQDQAIVPAGLVKGEQQLQFGATQLLPGELMRISSMQQRASQQPQQIGAHQLHQALLSSAASHPQQQRHFALYTDNEHEAPFSPSNQQGAAYYKRNSAQPMAASAAAAAMLQHQQPLIGQEGGSSFDLGDHTNYFDDIQAASLRANDNQLAQAGSGPVNQLHLEPTHTSEIVDKIEQHIGQQIEHNLKHDGHQADQKHQQQQTAAASGYQQAGEKETAQSEEQEETAAGHGGGGSESSVDESGEEKIEKRHEEPHKEHAESHKHHHEEHPPEAFEVHHKKGGKSFQYFHQGHHHHA